MFYVVYVMLGGLVVGSLLNGSNPSPFFGEGSFVFVAFGAWGILVVSGFPFLPLGWFWIMWGGMTWVLAYSVPNSSEFQPEAWSSWSVLPYFLGGVVGVVFVVMMVLGGNLGFLYLGFYSSDCVGFSIVRGDVLGVSLLYRDGLGGLLLLGYVLKLTLFVVLELVRGLASGCVRSVY
uniref:NADH-ubiquinone oxidoreductase chain 6 n=1 Tax=Varanus salvator komaini TaxID=735375 RepID=A0A0U5B516_VARSL|nr:NADH dehydrogenase subunit 6 [Varanus salvator komaini]